MVSVTKSFKGLPNGRYNFSIEGVNDDNYSLDSPNILLSLEVADGKYKGMSAIKNLNLGSQADYFTRPYMIAVGYKDQDLDNEAFNFDTQDLVGKKFSADYTNNGKYPNIDNPAPVKVVKQEKI
jgi:hypothetical protein